MSAYDGGELTITTNIDMSGIDEGINDIQDALSDIGTIDIDIDVPDVPDIDTGGISDIEVPDVPDIEVPDVPDIDTGGISDPLEDLNNFSFDSLLESIGSISPEMMVVAGVAATVAAAIVAAYAVVSAAFDRLRNKIIEVSTNIMRMADRFGVATSSIAYLSAAAAISGQNVEELIDALNKGRNIPELQDAIDTALEYNIVFTSEELAALSKMGDTFDLLSAQIDKLAVLFAPMLTTIGGWMSSVISALQGVVDMASPLVSAIGGYVSSIVGAIGSILGAIMDILSPLMVPIKFVGNILAVIYRVLEGIVRVVGEVFRIIGSLIKGFAEALGISGEDSIGEGINDSIAGFAESVRSWFVKILAAMNAGVASILRGIAPLYGAFADTSGIFDMASEFDKRASQLLYSLRPDQQPNLRDQDLQTNVGSVGTFSGAVAGQVFSTQGKQLSLLQKIADNTKETAQKVEKKPTKNTNYSANQDKPKQALAGG